MPGGDGAAAVGAPPGPARPGGPCPAEGVLEALRRLVDQSLVVAEADPGAAAARYRLLETVRQYAAERLAGAGEAEAGAVRGRHAAFYLALAEAAAPGLLGPEQPAWLDRLAGEHDNLRAALAWGLARAPGTALRLAGVLWPFWRMRQHYAEGSDWLARALAAAPEAGRTADWARAALGAGTLARDRGEVVTARGHLQASLACSRALGDPGLVAWALRDLGTLHVQRGEFGLAEARAEESLAIARIAGDRRGAAVCPDDPGPPAALRGDAGQARALGAQSLAAAREAGDPWLLRTVLQRVGVTALEQGDLGAAGPVAGRGAGPGPRPGAALARHLLRVPAGAGGPGPGRAGAGAPSAGGLPRRRARRRARRPYGGGPPRWSSWGGRPWPGASRRRPPGCCARRCGCSRGGATGWGPPGAWRPWPRWRRGQPPPGRPGSWGGRGDAHGAGHPAPAVLAARHHRRRGGRPGGPGGGGLRAARAAGAALSLEQATAEALQEAPPGAA